MDPFRLMFAKLIAEKAGASANRALGIGAACAVLPAQMGLLVAVVMGRAAAPPKQTKPAGDSKDPAMPGSSSIINPVP